MLAPLAGAILEMPTLPFGSRPSIATCTSYEPSSKLLKGELYGGLYGGLLQGMLRGILEV